VKRESVMLSQILKTTLGVLITVCCLQAGSPYLVVGKGNSGYSMSNLPKLSTPPPPTLDKDADGTCLTWAKYWAAPGAVRVEDDLVFIGAKNPYNSERGQLDCSFKFFVDRVVTKDENLDSGGFLKNPQALIAQGVVPPTITIEFAAIQYFHGNGVVRRSYGNGLTANYKVISVNGQKYWSEPPSGLISGWDWRFPVNQYTKVTFQVPVGMVKFPRRSTTLGSSPIAAENYLEVTTDMVGMSYAIPAIKLAWVKTSVKAMAPIFLVHGTNANPTTWDVPKGNSFNNYFSTFSGICFNDIALEPNGTIDKNGLQLEIQIASRLYGVGAKACHIVAHSKGGLDSRAFIKGFYDRGLNRGLNLYGEFEVLSLYTLNTPHRGTVISDISWNTQNDPSLHADPNWYDLQSLMGGDFGFLHNAPDCDPDEETSVLIFWSGVPTGHALEAQRTNKMTDWNLNHTFDFSQANTGGRPIRFYNTASDADWNARDLSIDSTEKKYSGIPFTSVATSMYRMLYWAKQVQTRPSTRQIMGKDGLVYATIPVTELFVPPDQIGAQWNDIVVSLSSAIYEGGTPFCPMHINNLGGVILSNHSNVKTSALAGGIIDRIRSDWPLDH